MDNVYAFIPSVNTDKWQRLDFFVRSVRLRGSGVGALDFLSCRAILHAGTGFSGLGARDKINFRL